MLQLNRSGEFKKLVEERILSKKSANYMDAILEVCELWNIDPEAAKGLIDQPLKEKLKIDASDLNFIRKVPTLY